MIPFNFEYHRADTLDEAGEAFRSLQARGKLPVYYGGGTEILTSARLGQIRPDAVIDIKSIAECQHCQALPDRVILGAGLTLYQVCQSNLWPLLTAAACRIADHSARCKITLGGNLAGTIYYREAALPLMLFPEQVQAVLYGPDGLRAVQFSTVFDGQLQLQPGEFLAQIIVDRGVLDAPGVSIKRTRMDWVDYPLFTVVAVRVDGEVRAAFGGVTTRPFCSAPINHMLSQSGSPDERARAATAQLPADVIDDLHGSSDYRRFLLHRTLIDALQQLEA